MVDVAELRADHRRRRQRPLMLEEAVRQYFRQQVKAHGGLTRKLNPHGQNHWPDELATTPELGLFMVELKRPKGGRLSEGQKEKFAKLERAGTVVRLAWTKEMVDALFG